VIYSFGRREQLDIEALQRLVSSISRFFSPEEQVRLQATTSSPEPLEFVQSRPAGGAYLLKAIWERINITSRREMQHLHLGEFLTKKVVFYSTPS
jgi:hypothetical protein